MLIGLYEGNLACYEDIPPYDVTDWVKEEDLPKSLQEMVQDIAESWDEYRDMDMHVWVKTDGGDLAFLSVEVRIKREITNKGLVIDHPYMRH